MGLIVFLILGGIGVGAFALGLILDGTGAPTTQCERSTERPNAGGPYFENTVVQGSPTFFPLGIACTFDVPTDAVGPQQINHPNWTATIVCVVCTIGAAGGFLLLIAPRYGFSGPKGEVKLSASAERS